MTSVRRERPSDDFESRISWPSCARDGSRPERRCHCSYLGGVSLALVIAEAALGDARKRSDRAASACVECVVKPISASPRATTAATGSPDGVPRIRMLFQIVLVQNWTEELKRLVPAK